MPETKRAWTDDDRAKIRSLAGKVPSGQIAAELGRTNAALAVQACKLGVSLRTSRSEPARPSEPSRQHEGSRTTEPARPQEPARPRD